MAQNTKTEGTEVEMAALTMIDASGCLLADGKADHAHTLVMRWIHNGALSRSDWRFVGLLARACRANLIALSATEEGREQIESVAKVTAIVGRPLSESRAMYLAR